MVVGLAASALGLHPVEYDAMTLSDPVTVSSPSVPPVYSVAPARPTDLDATSETIILPEAPAAVLPSRQPAGSPLTVPPTLVGGAVEWPVVEAPHADPFAPVTSSDVGEHCAVGLSASELSDFFDDPIGDFQGADYQRAFKLDDGRVLWTFQDAFIHGTLVHNVGMIQSGRCFTMLNDGARSWLLDDLTSHMHQWHWILGGAPSVDGTIHLFVVQMNETGGWYLNQTRPAVLRRVVLHAATLEVLDVIEEQVTGDDLYGWAVTEDGTYPYLYSHCFQQFGYETPLGFGECAIDVRVARVPVGSFDADREYWDGTDWSEDHTEAVPVVDGTFAHSGNNPAQIEFDGERFLLVEKRDDWWGSTIEFGVADQPQGPFEHLGYVDEPLKCDRSRCNTYFASWIPWDDESGAHIWAIGHNRWNGEETHRYLHIYRPTFHRIDMQSMPVDFAR